MKIRNGFVSNSSSSSFIISAGVDIPDVFTLANKMLDIRNKKCNNSTNNYNKEQNKIIQAKSLYINVNHPIAFNTTNYDTYIWKHNDNFLVNTCNNIDWDFNEYYISYDGILNDKNIYFWWPKEGVIGKSITDDEWTQYLIEKNIKQTSINRFPYCLKNSSKHYNTVVMTKNNKIICRKCYSLKQKDMLIIPALIKRKKEAILISPCIKLRG